jgi:3-oxoacyl-[acyl-carrier-protein] synthase III
VPKYYIHKEKSRKTTRAVNCVAGYGIAGATAICLAMRKLDESDQGKKGQKQRLLAEWRVGK